MYNENFNFQKLTLREVALISQATCGAAKSEIKKGLPSLRIPGIYIYYYSFESLILGVFIVLRSSFILYYSSIYSDNILLLQCNTSVIYHYWAKYGTFKVL